MPTLLTLEYFVLIFCIITLFVAAIIYWRRYRQNSLQSGFFPKTIQPSNANNFKILEDALKKADAIISRAEIEGLKTEAASSITARNMESKYETQLSGVFSNLEDQLAKQTDLASQEYTRFLADLRVRSLQMQKMSEQMQKMNEQYVQAHVNDIFERFEQNLTDFLMQTQQKSTTAVDLELQAARQLIETYKNQQLALVNENVVAMLEKTLSLVLSKKLTLADQIDLVHEALDKAKAEKFII